MMTTTTCPGCGAVINLEEIPDKPGRLQGRCGCNKGRPVLEIDAPKVEKKAKMKKESGKDEQEQGFLDGDSGEDGSSGTIYEVS